MLTELLFLNYQTNKDYLSMKEKTTAERQILILNLETEGLTCLQLKRAIKR